MEEMSFSGCQRQPMPDNALEMAVERHHGGLESMCDAPRLCIIRRLGLPGLRLSEAGGGRRMDRPTDNPHGFF